MNRYLFSDIFQENPDGSLSPRRVVSVNGATFGQGVSFGPGASFGGVNFHEYRHMDIAGEERGGILFIQGFYR